MMKRMVHGHRWRAQVENFLREYEYNILQLKHKSPTHLIRKKRFFAIGGLDLSSKKFNGRKTFIGTS